MVQHLGQVTRIPSNQLYASFFFRAVLTACGDSQARGLVGAVAAGLCHSHSNLGTELNLQPTPQLTAISDP